MTSIYSTEIMKNFIFYRVFCMLFLVGLCQDRSQDLDSKSELVNELSSLVIVINRLCAHIIHCNVNYYPFYSIFVSLFV
jgi:hypothetical protein